MRFGKDYVLVHKNYQPEPEAEPEFEVSILVPWPVATCGFFRFIVFCPVQSSTLDQAKLCGLLKVSTDPDPKVRLF